MAEGTKIALLVNTRNSIYEAVRLEEENPEARMIIEEELFQNLPAGRQVAGGAVKIRCYWQKDAQAHSC